MLMSKTMAHTITLANWQTHSADLIKIRTEVFQQEQNISAADEWDGRDEQAIHFLAYSAQSDAVGCARLLIENAGDMSAKEELYHIGRVAVLKSARNLGIGHQLMQFVIAYCREMAPTNIIYLHAQTERRHFYEALGFVAEGTEFVDAGIPHISMRLAQ